MLELISIPAIVGALESGALPAVGAFLASELIGMSKRTKSNSLLQIVFRVVKAIANELVKDGKENQAAGAGADQKAIEALVAAKVTEAIGANQSVATFEVKKPCATRKRRTATK